MALSKEELSKEFLCNNFESEKCHARISDEQKKKFLDNDNELAKKIAKTKLQYAIKHGYSDIQAYNHLEEECQISITALKKAMNPNYSEYKANRIFLYKFVIGLRLQLDEANEYFILCGGPLSENCLQDYICIRALEDGDCITDFIDEMEEVAKIKIGLRERRS